MCGIFVLIKNKSTVCDSHPSTTIKDQILSRLNRRGPDVIAEKFIELSDEYQATFIGSTLHLRGTEIQEQPLSNEDGDLLLWNGEIFGGIQVSETENDGNILMKKLTDCKSECETLNLFASIKGPYAFVYWQAKNKKLWIARDILGRRSLLINTTVDNNYHNNGCVNIKDVTTTTTTTTNNTYATNATSNATTTTTATTTINNDTTFLTSTTTACNASTATTSSTASAATTTTTTATTTTATTTTASTNSTNANDNDEYVFKNDIFDKGYDSNYAGNIIGGSSGNGNFSTLILSSVACQTKSNWNELPAIGVYLIDFQSSSSSSSTTTLSSSLSPSSSQPSPSSSSSSCKIHLFPWLWKPQINENRNDGTDTEMILTTTTTTYNNAFHDKYFNFTPESKNFFPNNFPCHLSNYGLFCHFSKFKHFGKLSGEKILKNDDGNSKYVHAVLSNTNQQQHQQKQHPIHRREQQHQRTQEKQQQNHRNHCNDFSSFATDERVKAMRDFLKLLGSSVEKRTSAESVCSCCNFCMQKMLEIKCDSNSLINNLKNSMTFSAPTTSSFPTSVASSSSLMTSSSPVICHHSKVAILFSGGLDSLVLALLANRYIQRLDPIDLLNVSFFNHSNREEALTPDRLTGLSGLDELRELCPNRKWNFVEIDVNVDELKMHREKSIKHLIHPLDTVLDDSIGCALWFAARGQGRLKLGQANVVCQGQGDVSNGNQLDDGNYVSPARVVLSGLGADELLAGYSRHRMKFGADENWELLGDELEREVTNLWNRNLGRDDRIISDHCREARFPYLDEDLVDFILSLDMHLKFDLRAPRGVGDKLLLRMAAQDLNLHKGSLLQKRAIQFGSRIAKLEGRKEKASEVCSRLVSDAEIS